MVHSNHRWLVKFRYFKPYILEDELVTHFNVCIEDVLVLFVLGHVVGALWHCNVCMNGVQMVLPTKNFAFSVLVSVRSIVHSRRLELIVFRHIGADRFLIKCLLLNDTMQEKVELLLHLGVSQVPGWRLEIFFVHTTQHLCVSHRRALLFLE